MGIVLVIVAGLGAAQLWPQGHSLVPPAPTPSPFAPAPTSVGLVASPSLSQTRPFPTVPPSAAPTPPLDGIPAVAWAPQAASRVLADDLLAGSSAEGGWGPVVYIVRGGRLDVVDLRTRSRGEAVLPLLGGEGVATMAVDGDVVAVLAARGGLQARPGQVGRCGSSTPIAWRLLAAPLRADGTPISFEVVTTGTTRRIFTDPLGPPCTRPWSNLIAVTGARVVIAEDAPTALHPWASTIQLFDLGPAAAIGPHPTTVSVPGVVYSLSAASGSLSGPPALIAWTATSGAPPDGAGNTPRPTWSVGYDLGGVATPVAIVAAGPTQGWLPLPAVAADDGVVWWGGTTISADNDIGPRVVRQTFVAGDAPGSTAPAAPALDAFDCELLGAAGGTALASCHVEGSTFEPVPVLVGGGQARQIAPLLDTRPISTRGGWLTWPDPPYIAGLPLASLVSQP